VNAFTRRTSAPTRPFLRHYAEMLAALLAGMAVLGPAGVLALGLLGVSPSELWDDAPTLLLGMALTMTVPMIFVLVQLGRQQREVQAPRRRARAARPARELVVAAPGGSVP
jgi:hypothetical protein